MEVMLRDCVEDVRQQIRQRKKSNAPATTTKRGGGRSGVLGTMRDSVGNSAVTVDDFSSIDRERVLELLFAKERVISLLQTKAFPPASDRVEGAGTAVEEEGAAGGISKEELNNLQVAGSGG